MSQSASLPTPTTSSTASPTPTSPTSSTSTALASKGSTSPSASSSTPHWFTRLLDPLVCGGEHPGLSTLTSPHTRHLTLSAHIAMHATHHLARSQHVTQSREDTSRTDGRKHLTWPLLSLGWTPEFLVPLLGWSMLVLLVTFGHWRARCRPLQGFALQVMFFCWQNGAKSVAVSRLPNQPSETPLQP